MARESNIVLSYLILVFIISAFVCIVAYSLAWFMGKIGKDDSQQLDDELLLNRNVESNCTWCEERSSERELLIESDKAILQSFIPVLSKGIIVKVQTDKGWKSAKLFLRRNELIWQTVVPGSRIKGKHSSLFLERTRAVILGKKTNAFISMSAAPLREELCFSLVTDRESLDLLCDSEIERDSLAHGFSILVDLLSSEKSTN